LGQPFGKSIKKAPFTGLKSVAVLQQLLINQRFLVALQVMELCLKYFLRHMHPMTMQMILPILLPIMIFS